MRLLYTILYTLGFLVTWPYWILRNFTQHKPYSFKSRFLGPGRVLPKRAGRPRVWLWALSLGEVMAAKKLVFALEDYGAEVIITSTTAIGRSAANRLLPGRLVMASPLDFDLSIRRFLNAVDPDLLVLVETDIWPGILWRLSDRKVPKALVSSRISPRSLKGYGYIKPFWGKVLRLFDLITTQSEDDRERLIQLGANQKTTVIVGDLKFDRDVYEPTTENRARLLKEAGWPDGRWIVAGSVHAGEETIIIDTFEELLPKYPDLKLLLAPRNQSDFEAMWHLLNNRDLPATHREAHLDTDLDQKVFLLDTLGELQHFYELAEIALVGKTWAGQHKGGGHNPLEPAALGKPVLFGPQTHNFRWMTKALAASGGGLMVPDQPALLAALDDLLANPEKSREMGQKALNFVKTHQGTVERTMEKLKPLFPKPKIKK